MLQASLQHFLKVFRITVPRRFAHLCKLLIKLPARDCMPVADRRTESARSANSHAEPPPADCQKMNHITGAAQTIEDPINHSTESGIGQCPTICIKSNVVTTWPPACKPCESCKEARLHGVQEEAHMATRSAAMDAA
mmetsp:Transcript_4379/g.8772  ORF Transcript_4379/g.8772 Transcript_4379/m.8772 type:complete len:137 (+) Transcript_4379:513-923(+)